MSFDFDEPKEASDVTVKELNTLCEDYRSLKAEAKAFEDKKKEKESQARAVQHKIIDYFEELGMKNHSGEFGTISVKKSYSVKQPQGEEKSKFFEYLRDRDAFDIVSVNSRTLCSYVRQEIDAQKSDGVYNWLPPGIDSVEEIKSLSLRKPK